MVSKHQVPIVISLIDMIKESRFKDAFEDLKDPKELENDEDEDEEISDRGKPDQKLNKDV